MAETVCDTSELCLLLESAREVGVIDLSKLLGSSKPLFLGVDNLLDAIVRHETPSVSLHWDGDKTLLLHHADGRTTATFILEL